MLTALCCFAGWPFAWWLFSDRPRHDGLRDSPECTRCHRVIETGTRCPECASR